MDAEEKTSRRAAPVTPESQAQMAARLHDVKLTYTVPGYSVVFVHGTRNFALCDQHNVGGRAFSSAPHATATFNSCKRASW